LIYRNADRLLFRESDRTTSRRGPFVMPYRVNSDLPPSVRSHLPDHAQSIYRESFNHAYASNAGEPDREQRAHMIAWAAVKRSYVKAGDIWVLRHDRAERAL
jgi:cation transport regulator